MRQKLSHSRKSTQAVLKTLDAPCDIVVDFHSKGLGLRGVTQVLNPRRCVGKDGVAHSVFVRMFDADICEVHDLLEMLIWVCAKEAGPPPGLLREAGKVESLFEDYLAEHCISVI